MAAVVSDNKIIWTETILTRMLALKTELVAPTKALELQKEEKHRRYVPATAHVHGAIYR